MNKLLNHFVNNVIICMCSNIVFPCVHTQAVGISRESHQQLAFSLSEGQQQL